MGLLLHEMATNAVKYGALSNARAGWRSRWSRAARAARPSPGAKRAARRSQPPAKPGFGTRLLQQVLRPQGGEVTFAFDPAGFRARVEFPTVR